jgi:glycosyltransferase involved in cell wall biosynthesis
MHLAFLFQWYTTMSRPHHWVIESIKNGHQADVYTQDTFPWKRIQVPRHYASHIFDIRSNFIEGSLMYIWSLMGCTDSPWYRRRIKRRCGIWEGLWNGEIDRGYDAVIFCGPVPCIVERKNRKIPLIYDCMDQWDGFIGMYPKIKEYEESLVKAADIVWAVTPNLAERITKENDTRNCYVIPNGCDYEHFSEVSLQRHPSNWKPGIPVIGYVGAIGTWFDWDAVFAIAKSFPGTIVWIIGPCCSEVPSNIPSNVIMQGFVPYEQLPDYYAGFDVAIIPFKGERLSHGISPIKLYEYLASGKPVVSSKMPDSMHLSDSGVIEIANASSEFPMLCSRLIEKTNNELLIQKRQNIARNNSWASRWEMCEKSIDEMCR